MTTELFQNTTNLNTAAVERLTHRERDVFELIGQGLATNAIAECLSVTPSIVETYRARIIVKLNLATGLELNRFAVLWFARDLFQR